MENKKFVLTIFLAITVVLLVLDYGAKQRNAAAEIPVEETVEETVEATVEEVVQVVEPVVETSSNSETIQEPVVTTSQNTSTTQNTTVLASQNGIVRGRVLVDGCEPLVCGIELYNQDTGLRYRTTTDITGGFNLSLTPGQYIITFERGNEYSKYVKELNVKKYSTNKLGEISLTHVVDMYAKNWISGDLHMHTYYSDGSDCVANQLLGNISQGLYFGFLTDHNAYEGLREWVTGNNLVAWQSKDGIRNFNAWEGLEITTQYGHYQSLGAPVYFPDEFTKVDKKLAAKKGTEEYDQEIKSRILTIAEEVKKNCVFAQINHPYSLIDMGYHYWDIAENFDTIEIWNGVFVPGDGRHEDTNPNNLEQNYQSKLKWYELLNEVKNGGKFFAATCGTDNHDSSGKYLYKDIDCSEINDMATYNEVYNRKGIDDGVPAIYAYCEGEITCEKILTSIAQGHSFLTNGITMIANVDGKIFGDTVEISDLNVLHLECFCWDGLERIQIVKNGTVAYEINLDEHPQTYSSNIVLENLESDDWIVLEICGVETNYAISNPIFFK